MIYQKLRRKNDPSGNGFSLICLYNSKGELMEIAETNTSQTSSYELDLHHKDVAQIMELFLEPKVYNNIKKYYDFKLKHIS